MATITIHTQYYENYSDTATPHWKPKGCQIFEIENILGDMIMYCGDLKEVLIRVEPGSLHIFAVAAADALAGDAVLVAV